MGWFIRGTGRSLLGSAALVGYFSKKVLSYVTLNRKCKQCNEGKKNKIHDCRVNFKGSAKAMEPYAAVELTVNNDISKKCNVNVGFLIADNDSCSINAVRNASSFDVVKHSDKNHTSKGVSNEINKLVSKHKELDSSAVKFIQKCYRYAVSQNTRSIRNMTAAIQNIPYHCFNTHDDCGTWYSFLNNPDHIHNVISNGFTSQA